MSQYGKKPHDCDGQVLGIGMALSEGRTVHEQHRNSNRHVKREAQGQGV
jgi:hypothetical protein